MKNVDIEFKRLKALQDETISKNHSLSVANMVKDLEDATPVATGKARRSWSVARQGNVFTVANSVPYIQYLNQGSSKQAPAYFVEAIALVYGKPQGTIVEVVQD